MSFLKNLMSKIKDRFKSIFKKKKRGFGGSTVLKHEGIIITNRDYISYSKLDKPDVSGLTKIIKPRNKVIKKITLHNFMENSGGNKRKKLMIKVILGVFYVLLILSYLFSYMFMLIPLFLIGFLRRRF